MRRALRELCFVLVLVVLYLDLLAGPITRALDRLGCWLGRQGLEDEPEHEPAAHRVRWHPYGGGEPVWGWSDKPPAEGLWVGWDKPLQSEEGRRDG